MKDKSVTPISEKDRRFLLAAVVALAFTGMAMVCNGHKQTQQEPLPHICTRCQLESKYDSAFVNRLEKLRDTQTYARFVKFCKQEENRKK